MTQASILIVDDCEINRFAMGGFLSGPGFNYSLHFATTGSEALEMARTIIPDLVLLDVMMPELDGFEVSRQLRNDPILAEIPIIMVTALEDSSSKVRGFASGADEFISKPIHCDELRARVANIMRLNRFRQLVRQRSRFEWVIEHAGDGFVLVQEDGNTAYANHRARELLSLNENGRPLLSHLRSRFECVPSAAWESQASLQAWHGERLYLVKAETAESPASWLQITIGGQVGDGELIVRVSDVSDTVIERMNAWSLRSMVSHKLRTPLTKLTLSLSLVKKLSEPALLRPLIEQRLAEAGVDDLRRVIEGILNILGTSAVVHRSSELGGQANEGMEAADLPHIVEQVTIEAGCAQAILESPQGEFQGTLQISPHVLKMALRGLFENAVRSHPKGQPTIVVRLQVNSVGLVVRVEDDGVCLKAAQLERALLPYHQGPAAGLGTGLAMVASMMWMLGCDCRLSNRQPGPGLLVELAIPWLH